MADTFQFDLVAPERLLMSEPVEQVTVPGADGQFTVLKDHAPVLSTLRPGVLDIRTGEGPVQRIYVRGGFAEVNPTRVTVLAEQAMPMEEVSADVIAQQVADAEEDVADAGEDVEKRATAQRRLDDLKDIQRWLLDD